MLKSTAILIGTLYFCRVYYQSENCIQSIVNDCETEQSKDLPQAKMILTDLKQGFGRLCNDEFYFDGKW